jgi:hypothetical protein
VKVWRRLLPVAVLLGCSGLDEGEAGVVAIEVRAPSSNIVEVGEAIQLTATPLDADGNPVSAPVSWRSPDNTVSVEEATGIVTGVAPGPARVQAAVGSLSSGLLSFNVIAPADTIVLVGDSVVVVPVEPGTSSSLSIVLQSFHPAGVLGSRPVIFEVTRPRTEPLTVTLSSGDLIDTLQTAADGTAGVSVTRVAGAVVTDSVFVEVRASRTRGGPVPGSGQRFIVLFQ